MAATDLKALRFPFKDPKFIFFTDFDGTITLKDSNDFMVSRLSLQNSNTAELTSK
jgi:2-hydroxy-3-keto-5-methylthiopentenyl-1-phosphate phosphatase